MQRDFGGRFSESLLACAFVFVFIGDLLAHTNSIVWPGSFHSGPES